MSAIAPLLERLAAAARLTSWRCELGRVDPALVARVDAAYGPLPAEYREFLANVRTLENRTGDVTFFAARDLADADGFLRRAVDGWRREDLSAAGPYPESLAAAQGFWQHAVPIVCSTVTGDDFLALDRRAAPACVVEARGEGGWSETARVCAASFGEFLGAFTDVFASGPAAFECGWRLTRAAVARLQARDARFRESLVPLVFVTDFDAAAPPRRPTRPTLAARR